MSVSQRIRKNTMTTLIFVFAADRGHFQFSIPLAEKLVTDGVVERIEYFVHDQAREWIPSHKGIQYGGSLGVFPKEFVNMYVEMASHGESFAQGCDYVNENIGEAINDFRAKGLPVPEFGVSYAGLIPAVCTLDEIQSRINDPDVIGVVGEGSWNGFLFELQCSKPFMIINPSVYGPLKLKSAVDKAVEEGIIPKDYAFESTLEGIQKLGQAIGYSVEPSLKYPTTFTLSKHLRYEIEKFIPLDISRWEDAILPQPRKLLDGSFLGFDSRGEDLHAFLGACADDEEFSAVKDVVLCSLGSHMLARCLTIENVNALIEGILNARISCGVKEDGSESTVRAKCVFIGSDDVLTSIRSCHLSNERFVICGWIDQWKVLSHPKIACFLSHCGANSSHEAFANGVPIVGLPMFDDQYNNAYAIEAIGYGLKLKKFPCAKEVSDKVSKVASNRPDNPFRRKAHMLSKDFQTQSKGASPATCKLVEEISSWRSLQQQQ